VIIEVVSFGMNLTYQAAFIDTVLLLYNGLSTRNAKETSKGFCLLACTLLWQPRSEQMVTYSYELVLMNIGFVSS
jgi:hypothetical protein